MRPMHMADDLPLLKCRKSRLSGALTYPETLGPPRPVAGHLYFTLLYFTHTISNFEYFVTKETNAQRHCNTLRKCRQRHTARPLLLREINSHSWFKREYRMFWCLWLDQFRWPKLQIMLPPLPFPIVPGILCPCCQEPIDIPLYSSHTTPKFNVTISTCECKQCNFRDILKSRTGYCSFTFSTHGL
jgi:hypothetical protein